MSNYPTLAAACSSQFKYTCGNLRFNRLKASLTLEGCRIDRVRKTRTKYSVYNEQLRCIKHRRL